MSSGTVARLTTLIKERIVEGDALLTDTELEEFLGQACSNFNSPPTDTSVYIDPLKYKELIDSYTTGQQAKQFCKDEDITRLPYLNLGCVYFALGEYEKSLTWFEKAANLGKELDNKQMESRAYINLALSAKALDQQDRSRDYSKKALRVMEEDEGPGQKQCCAHVLYNKQGTLYHDVGNYDKSLRYLERSLKLSEELRDKPGEGSSHYNLGSVYCTMGQYEKAEEHHKKCLMIRVELEDRLGECVSYIQLAYLSYIQKTYHKAIKRQEKALEVSKEIGALEVEATSYDNLGSLWQAVGDYNKSIEYHHKCMALRKKFEALKMEHRTFKQLSGLNHVMGNHRQATACQVRSFPATDERAIEFICSSSDSLPQEIFQIIEVMRGNNNDFFLVPITHRSYTTKLDVTKALELYAESIKRHERIRRDLDNESKLLVDDLTCPLYKTNSLQLSSFRNTNAALFNLEKGRARVLVDSIRKAYGYQTAAPGIDRSGIIGSLIEKQQCDFLFIGFLMENLVIWFVDSEGNLTFKQYSETDPRIKSTQDLLQTLAKEVMETMILRKEGKGNEHEGKEHKEKRKNRDSGLRGLYKALIAPIRSLIKSREVVIVPEGYMFKVLFAALKDENGESLSDKVRIRIIPSLTSLKLIQDAPVDYHSKTGAFIVGIPNVGLKGFDPLPCIESEVKKISKLLNQPYLVGKQATKEAVLRGIQEPVSVIHISTHGSKRGGEAALAPDISGNVAPVRYEDFVLTVKDIRMRTIKALLVVLSFCYGLSGEVMTAEGVVGIAHAFLGSGARAVLACLCPVRDVAASNFMNFSYKNLARERLRASEALNKAQQEMRDAGFKDEQDWAPFVLIGDNVSIDVATD